MKERNGLLRLLAVLIAAMLVFAACGGGEEEPADDEPAATEDGGEEPAGDYTLITEGTLTVGSDIPYPPFEFEEGGELTGFDVELVRAVAEHMGLENPDDAWISTDFDTIFQQLAGNNKFDIVVAAVTGYAPEGSPASETVADRNEVIDFTTPYYPS
ncbi:MAG TPA: transporter substrate-binding domain-containing protein, partial [Actinomycetota bacterium]|nr:transporter substrate-binding domain-containing protein [Actinomycetota bacterium]